MSKSPVSIEKITGMVKARLYDDAAALLARDLLDMPKGVDPIVHERMMSTLNDLQKLIDKSNKARIDFMSAAFIGFCIDGELIGERVTNEMPHFIKYQCKDNKLTVHKYSFHTLPLSVNINTFKLVNANVWSTFTDPLAVTFSLAHVLNNKLLTLEQLT